jgi:hypothetical protein
MRVKGIMARECEALAADSREADRRWGPLPVTPTSVSKRKACCGQYESTHHFNTIPNLVIVIGFFCNQWDFKKIIGKGG